MKRIEMTSILGLMLIAVLFSPISSGSDKGAEPSRAPPLKVGHITSDEDWTTDLEIENVTIDSGVNVTVGPGVVLYMTYMSSLFVEGDLTFAGTSASPVQVVAIDGHPWTTLQVNGSGKVDLQNFTMREGSSGSISLMLYGQGSVVRNADIDGGLQSFYLNMGGEHFIENVHITNSYYFGLYVYQTWKSISIRNLTVENPGSGGVGLNGCSEVTFEELNVIDSKTSGIYMTDSTRITVTDFNITWSIPTKRVGLEHINNINDIVYSKGTISNCDRAFFFDTCTATDISIENVDIPSSVNVTLMTMTSTIDQCKFYNCTFGQSGPNMDIHSFIEATNVELLNTTYDSGKEFLLDGDCEVRTSWYLSLSVLDGIGRPLDSNVTLKNLTRPIVMDRNLPDGVLSDLPVLSRVSTMFQDDVVFYDLFVHSKDYPQSSFRKDLFSMDRSVKMEVVIDLHPYRDRPLYDIEMDEDSIHEMELTDHFFDPEGWPLTFEISADENLTAVVQGTLLSISPSYGNWTGHSDLKIKCFDDAGNYTVATMSVHVVQVNDPPYLIADLPDLKTLEDIPTSINLTGMAADVEGDVLSWSFVETANCNLEWAEMGWNLSIRPAPDFTGTLDIPLNLTDGSAWVECHLFADVLPVNDPPLPSVNVTGGPVLDPMYNNGTLFFEATLLEDEPMYLSIGATDPDSTDLKCRIVWSEMTYGDVLPIEGYEPNWTYSLPLELGYQGPRDFSGLDILPLNITDGNESILFYIIFNVSSVNDPPKFHVDPNWNFQVTTGVETLLDLSQFISDPDHDELTISVDPDDQIEVVGMTLHITFPTSISEDEVIVNVTASDGSLSSSGDLRITIEKELPYIGSIDVDAVDDGWEVKVEAEEGLTLYLIVIGGDGVIVSYRMTYSDGRYRAFVPEERFDAGDNFFIALDEEGDRPLTDSGWELTKSEESERVPMWAFLLAALLLISILGALFFILAGKKREAEAEE